MFPVLQQGCKFWSHLCQQGSQAGLKSALQWKLRGKQTELDFMKIVPTWLHSERSSLTSFLLFMSFTAHKKLQLSFLMDGCSRNNQLVSACLPTDPSVSAVLLLCRADTGIDDRWAQTWNSFMKTCCTRLGPTSWPPPSTQHFTMSFVNKKKHFQAGILKLKGFYSISFW